MNHACPNLPINILISKGSSYFGPDTGWVLEIFREATEDDLEENEYLDDVGDLIWTTVAEISHCPYCGEHLQPLSRNPADGSVQVACYDYSGWTTRKL
ncbi:hypothetical protein [Cyclonatronum proteinivorum]|nr:hypothetical protein [Cyclonatronum proteinivorum]